jgi:hypothetical protein
MTIIEVPRCDVCGGYNCSPCDDCDLTVHTNGGFPFCPHGISGFRSGFEEYVDDLTFKTDKVFHSAHDLDLALKKAKLEIKFVPHGKRWL